MSKIHDKGSDPKPKHPLCDEQVEKVGGKKGGNTRGGPRHIVRIRSYRIKLVDVDNLYGGCKHFIDALRLCSVIPDDDPNSIDLSVTQEKVSRYSEIKTEIEVSCV